MNTNTIGRRGFMTKVAGGATAGIAAAMLPHGALAAEQEPWKMKLSTSSIQYMQLPFEQACEKIAALGFEAIDIWSAHEKCPHLDDVAKRLGADGLKKVLAKNKLKLYAFSVYSGGYARYAKLLGDAGGGVAIRGSAGAVKPEGLTAAMKKFHEGLKPLADLAEKHNSYLAIENHGRSLLSTPDSLKAFVDTNKSKRIGIALAPYHLQGLKASVPDAIKTCGKQLFFFYAWQHQPGVKQLPGVGTTDMQPWIDALSNIRYERYVNPFMHGHPTAEVMSANLAKARDYLNACYAKTNK